MGFVIALIGVLELVASQRATAQYRATVLPGVRFGPPLRASAALGVTYGDSTAASMFAGPIATAEAGIGGGRASVGVVFAGPLASGLELVGSAIRTWGSPAQVPRARTLAGAEGRLILFAVNIGVGVFHPVGGPEGDRRTRYFLNVGLGI